MKQMFLSACAVFLFGLTSLASADFTFTLAAVPGIDGEQANAGAGTGSNATGTATMTYDQLSGLFSWNISWSGLAATAAHFHGPAPAAENAGVQVPISGLTSPSIGSAVITPAQAEDLLAGLWYINIHTAAFPGGEIRGQVDLAPRICKAGADTDNDSILDQNDNCCIAPNTAQTDTDDDGYGNACDMDIDQSGDVDFLDVILLRCAFFGIAPQPRYNPQADCNVDGAVNFIDSFGVDSAGAGFLPHSCMVQNLFREVGPSCVDLPADQIGPECSTDQDADGISNAIGIPHVRDNCTLIANPDQLDTDGDGFGNVCDPDLNNDCVVDEEDVDIMQLALFSTPGAPDWNPDADLNGDLVIDLFDLTILSSQTPGRPGPSARPLASCSGVPGCGPPPPPLSDHDSDGILNTVDNCTLVANPDQRDTNGDGLGNICDPDLNNDCVVNDDDSDILMKWFFTPPGVFPDGDLNGDLEIGFADLTILQSYFGESPGPSGLPNCTNDFDDDDIVNPLDNCTLVANADQLDTNGDGFGNVCDPDLNNDCVVNDDDVDILMQWFFSPPGVFPDGDLNGDLEIGFADLTILQSYFGQSPGPSGLADCTGVP